MKGLIFLLSVVLTGHSSDGAQKTNVTAEISKITDKFEKFEKPSPAFVGSIMQQFHESCRTNRTFDHEELSQNMSVCMDKIYNGTELVTQFQESIPKGNLDNVFRNICLRWPKVQACIRPMYDIIEECWENGTKISTAVDSMVSFFCGKNNDGAYIALFFAEGGLSCLETYGDRVRDCVNEQNTDDHQEDLCRSVEQVYECLTPLRKCDDVTPHNLVSSMTQEVGRVVGCPPIRVKQSGGTSMLSPFGLTLMIIPAIATTLPFAFATA